MADIENRRNPSFDNLTAMFAQKVPSLEEIATVANMSQPTNAFQMLQGGGGGQMPYAILQGLRAAERQQMIQAQNALTNIQNHMIAKQKLVDARHSEALDHLREATKMQHAAAGRFYSELLKVLPQLDSGSASSLLDSVINDPVDVMQLGNSVAAEQMLIAHMAKVGIRYKVKKKGGTTAKVVKGTDNVLYSVKHDLERGLIHKTFKDGTTTTEPLDLSDTVETKTDEVGNVVTTPTGAPTTRNVNIIDLAKKAQEEKAKIDPDAVEEESILAPLLNLFGD